MVLRKELITAHKCDIKDEHTDRCYVCTGTKTIDELVAFIENADDSQLLMLFKAYELDFDDFTPKDRERIYQIRVVPSADITFEDCELGSTSEFMATGNTTIKTDAGAVELYNKHKVDIEFEDVDVIITQYEYLLNYNGENTKKVRVRDYAIYGVYLDKLAEEIVEARRQIEAGEVSENGD